MFGYGSTATRSGFSVGTSWLVTVYLVIGGIVAATHHYWTHLDRLKAWASALLATVFWPLVLFGVNLHIH